MRCFTPVLLTVATLGLTAVTVAAAGPVRVETGLSWHDNVTNAERPEDLLPALQWHARLDAGIARNLPDGHRIRGAAGLRIETWPRFEGLDFVSPALSAAWEFKPGLGPNRPVVAAEVEGEWRVAREHDRGGLGGAVGLSVRQRLGTAWLLSVGHEWRRFSASGHAFDRTGREWSARAEWALNDRWMLAAEVHGRFGDVVSYSRPPRADLEAIGKPITLVDTFEQGVPWIVYYFGARTRRGAVEVQRTLGRSGVALRHELRYTLHVGPGYRNQLTMLRFVTSF
ncbi:MAG: hypothetical protein QG602_32 [Verrucomicrobiota bacterium]|nr:hypothetical protein [Verrucomicrobiota bacterium]